MPTAVPATIPTALTDSDADQMMGFLNTNSQTDESGNAWTRASVKTMYASAADNKRRALWLLFLFIIAL